MKRLLQTFAVSVAFLLAGGSANAQTDLSKMRVAAISEALTTQPEEGKYYLLEQNRGGTMTPAGDTGEGGTITRASSADAVSVGDCAEDVESYLLQFIPTGDVSSTGVGGVYTLQWATGNYWVSIEGVTDGTGITTTSDAEEAGIYNVYPTTTGGNLFGLNAYDMGKRVDNNGVGAILTGWGDGQNTAISGNNVWTIYEVTFEDMTEEEIANHERWKSLNAVFEEAQAAYDANEDEMVALISSTEQFSSPYTESSEGSLDNLLDGNADTYWHSDWSDGRVDNGVHYIQVDLADDFVGGDLILSILRRNNQNNHVVKMSIKDGEDNLIDTVDLPYNGQGETVEAEFNCPEGIYTLRFYNEGTVGNSQSDQGFFHLAGLQLYYAISGNNTKYPDVAAALAAAIETAQSLTVKGGTVSDSDIAALQEALDTYLAEIAPLLTVLAYESVANIDEWTTTGNNGTFELNTWSVEADASGMVTPFCQNWVWEGDNKDVTLTTATISHKTLVGMPAGNYDVSLDIRILNEDGFEIGTGTTFNANGESVDLTEGTAGTYEDATEVYGTYTLTCAVDETGTLDISIQLPEVPTYNWIAWKNLTVTLSTEDMPALTALDGKMSAAAEEAMTAAIAAYAADNTEENFVAAIAAIQDAQASIEEYAEIATLVDALDEAGLAVWNVTVSGAAYNAGTLDAGTDITADMAAAQIAQTTAGSDMTYVVLYTGEWTGNTGTYVDGVEHYQDNSSGGACTGTAEEPNKILYKTIEGLTPGTYEVSFYAVANVAWNDYAYGENIAQIFANDAAEDIEVISQVACTPTDYPHTLQCTVDDDGTLEFGLQNIATGGNWYVCQAISLTLVETSEAEEEEDLSELIAQYKADLAEADTLVAELKESIEINEANEGYDTTILAEMEEALAGLQEAISTYGNIDTAATTKEELEEAIAALEAAMETASNAYATAISSVATEAEANDVIYTIGGTRVSKATKGVYIVNGKKVLVK